MNFADLRQPPRDCCDEIWAARLIGDVWRWAIEASLCPDDDDEDVQPKTAAMMTPNAELPEVVAVGVAGGWAVTCPYCLEEHLHRVGQSGVHVSLCAPQHLRGYYAIRKPTTNFYEGTI